MTNNIRVTFAANQIRSKPNTNCKLVIFSRPLGSLPIPFPIICPSRCSMVIGYVDSEYNSMKVSVIWFICPQILFIFAMKISQIQVTSSHDRSVSFCDHPMKLTLILQLTNQNTP